RGEVAGGIVIARHGENAREVIRRVEERMAALRPSLPPGVQLITTYDRSALIDRSIGTLRHALIEEAVVVALVIVLFLLHLRSALLPVLTMPLAVLLSFIPFYYAGLPATIMSLGGIAIALGATVDAEIVMIEACHKKLEGAPAGLTEEQRRALLAEAAREVTPAIFFSLLIVAAAFLPVFGLEGQAGRMFRPLAMTKTGVMLVAAVLSVTLAPALRDMLLRGETYPEHRHPVSRVIRSVYEPFVYVALRKPLTTVLIGLLAVLSAIPPALRLGSEFMPELDEGDLLYMPTTLPGISIEEAKRQLQLQDAVVRTFPEVLSVHGKAGRAETPTDPAPLSMLETVIRLQPAASWPEHPRPRWYSSWAPDLVQRALRPLWPDRGRRTRAELVTALDAALASPGWKNAWTMPIRNRIDMLATGIRTPVGLKIFARTPDEIDRAGEALESLLARQPGVRHALYERTLGGYTIDVTPRPGALARHGLRVDDLNALVTGAIGGTTVTTALDGRARYPVTVRYLQDFRGTPDALRALPVPLPSPGEPARGGGEPG
ncbi:MAG: efflux RND transporter permease subunit, partial [Myxococcales bacterium]